MMTHYNESTQEFWVDFGKPVLRATVEKIEGFSRLPAGWHFGEGGPPSAETIKLAIQFESLGRLMGFRTDAFPGIDGGIIVAFYATNDHCLELTIHADGALSIAYEIGVGFNYIEEDLGENVSIEEIFSALKRLADSDRCSSDQLASSFMIRDAKGSPLNVSPRQAATARFRSSTWTASRLRAA